MRRRRLGLVPEGVEEAIARNLKAARVARGLTQAELAEAVGITVESLSRAERGTILPTVKTLAKVATVLGTTIDELAGQKGRPLVEDRTVHASEAPMSYAAAPSPAKPEDADRQRLLRRLAQLDDRSVRRLLALVELLPRADKKT